MIVLKFYPILIFLLIAILAILKERYHYLFFKITEKEEEKESFIGSIFSPRNSSLKKKARKTYFILSDSNNQKANSYAFKGNVCFMLAIFLIVFLIVLSKNFTAFNNLILRLIE